MSRRLSDFFLTASYTWSKNITNLNGGDSDGGYRFYVPSQVSKNRTLTDFDRTHTFTAAMNYHLPFGKGKKFASDGVAAAALGGWQLNPYLSLYSGRPFTVGTDGASLNAPNNTQVADQVKEGVERFGGVGTGAYFYDPTAFASVSQPRFGNTSPNLLRGPNLRNLNLSVFRRFDVTERVNLQFRAEGLNITNTPALNNPGATVTTPASFMQITGAGVGLTPQRTFRFGLRLGF